MAASLDGRSALHNGMSQWITGPEARADGHHWRARSCVVLTGMGTVLKDDPQLNVRGVDTPRQPRKAVVDGRFEIPEGARLPSGRQERARGGAAGPSAGSRGPAGHDALVRPGAVQ
ncbi:hypothetical protein G6F65_020179 [Rhizopus arrhizus]|nr:hypothetical protein G6F65_020179 [Rhizopus arrhizus]